MITKNKIWLPSLGLIVLLGFFVNKKMNSTNITEEKWKEVACGDTEVSAINISSTTATLSWTIVDNATVYNILQLPSWNLIAQVSGGTTSYDLVGLTPATEYTFCVDVWCGEENNSGNCVTFSTSSSNDACNPVNVSNNSVTANTAVLNWSSISNATAYQITLGIGGPLVAEVGANQTSYSLTNLIPNTDYVYCVSAICGASESIANCTSFTTEDDVVVSECGSPSVTVGTVTNTSALINWSSVQNAVVYNLLLVPGWNLIGQEPAGVTSFNVTNLTPNTEYMVCIDVHCTGGEVNTNNCVSFVTSDGTPTCNAPFLSAPNINNQDVSISWGAVSNANSYMLELSGPTSSSDMTTNTSYSYSSLSDGNYTFCVNAICGSQESTSSCVDFVIGSGGCNGVFIPDWSPSSGAFGIELDLNSIGTKPISSHIIGTNRNHVLNMLTGEGGYTGIEYYPEMFAAYKDQVIPQFGEGERRKLYRIGHLPTDGTRDSYDEQYNLVGLGYPGFFYGEDYSAGEYPYDDFQIGLDEGIIDLNADLSLVVNLGDPDGAAQMVTDLIASGEISRVKYFEIGNEVGFSENRLHCTYGCTAEDYVAQAIIVEQAMRAAAGSVEIKIGFVGSIAADWAGSGCDQETYNCGPNFPAANITTGWLEYEDYLPMMVETAKAADAKIDFFIFHNYLSWPLIKKDDLFASSNSNEYVAEYILANNAQTSNTLEIVRGILDVAASENNLGYTIEIAATECGTELQNHQSMETRTIEGLYTADRLLTAVNHELLTDVAFCFMHWVGVGGHVTDNLFFDLETTTNDPAVFVKPTFEVQEFMAANLGNLVVKSEANFPQNSIERLGEGPMFTYDLISYAATERDNGTIVITILNRDEQAQFLDIDPGNGTSVSFANKKVLLSEGWEEDHMVRLADEELCTLENVELPPHSITVIELSMNAASNNDSGRGRSIVGEESREKGKWSIEKIYPNPTTDNITFTINSQERKEGVLVSIFNVLGEEVAQKTVDLLHDENYIQWNVSELPNGIYHVIVNGDRKRASQFVKQ